MSANEKISRSSGCVFADLGVERPANLEQAQKVTPNEKHRETAAEILMDAIRASRAQSAEAGVEIVAHALAAFQREGMKRAAEIAREPVITGNQNAIEACVDFMEAWEMGADDAIGSIVKCILTEAGVVTVNAKNTAPVSQGRTYAVADLHGRLDLLEAALERIEAQADGGTIVFMGDYIDRGPDSKGVLDRLMAGPSKQSWRWVCLKGNHEDMMVGAIRGRYQPEWWIGNGGGETIVSFDGEVSAEYVGWAERLPTIYSDGKRIFVHAGVDEALALLDQTEETLLWSRVPRDHNYSHPEGYVVHGHTPFEEGPIILDGRANLDTGACWTGRLVVAVFDNAVPGGPISMIEVVDAGIRHFLAGE